MNPRDIMDMLRRRGGSRCTEIGRLIQPHLDGSLDAARAAKVAAHLDACRRCGLTAADYRQLKQALATASAPLPAEPLRRLRDLTRDLARQEPSTRQTD